MSGRGASASRRRSLDEVIGAAGKALGLAKGTIAPHLGKMGVVGHAAVYLSLAYSAAAAAVAFAAGVARAAPLAKAMAPLKAVLGYATAVAKAKEAMAAGPADAAKAERLWKSSGIRAAGASAPRPGPSIG